MTFFYNSEEFYLSNKHSNTLEIIFITLISVFIVGVLAFLFFLWRRHRIVKSLLKFNEQDMNNVDIGLEKVDTQKSISNEPILAGYENKGKKQFPANYNQFQDDKYL
eukprot:TRINITY_DN7202_c0_g1_i2.p2 TRINITY_DN7202_c0_g1~~TRINITY_DN7202_c0_g1_i2.p2  ORF type:complete len:107 (+),score=17.73 TRINITY_DN7202_c0_g1_i2:1084-1404(+)